MREGWKPEGQFKVQVTAEGGVRGSSDMGWNLRQGLQVAAVKAKPRKDFSTALGGRSCSSSRKMNNERRKG